MSAPKIAGLLAALAFVLVLLSAVLGSAIFGNQALAIGRLSLLKSAFGSP